MGTYPDVAGHRDVETSIAAADAITPKLSRLQKIALGPIRDAREHGLTSDELEDVLDFQRWSLRPRTSELMRMGLIRDSGQRRQNCTGKLAIVWIAT